MKTLYEGQLKNMQHLKKVYTLGIKRVLYCTYSLCVYTNTHIHSYIFLILLFRK